jgi:hemerythrin-like metal-binding protein
MTEPLIWRDAWLLDIELLDADHREMVRLMNRLSDPDDPQPLSRRITELIEHLRRHFHIEQVFLRAIDYPELDEHSREHALQLAELVDLSRRLARTDKPVLDDTEIGALKDWFFPHVIAGDRRFAAYYREIVCGA